MTVEKYLWRSPFKSLDCTDRSNIFLIIGTWVGMTLVVNPVGNFPLNDDWAYGWTVKNFLETGEYQLSDWTATNLLSQVLWGTMFCLPFGFSFTALRISTLTLGLLGVLSTYGLLRETKASASLSLLGAAIVAFNPIYFVSSNSFNSDVPSFTFAIASLYLIARGLRTTSNTAIIFGILMSFVSILNRQSGIAVLLAFGLASIAKKGIRIQVITLAFLPACFGAALQFGYSYWLHYTNKVPALYGFQIKNLLETFSGGASLTILTYLKNIVIMSVYLGLFLFPFLLIYFSVWIKSLSFKDKRLCTSLLLLMLGIAAVFVLHGKQMPFAGNILESYGVGPQSLDGYYSFSSSTQVLVSRLWKLITVVGFLSAGMLLLYFAAALLKIINHKRDQLEVKWVLILTVSTALLYLVAIAGLNIQYWFDRYLIFLLPILMMLISELTLGISHKSLNSIVIISLIGLLASAGFSISATHDYLSWNRVKWQALDTLVQVQRISPQQINGGAEFNGWYFGNKLETCNSKYQTQSKPTNPNWGDFDCLWGDEGNSHRNYLYTVGFATKAGYNIAKQYSFRRWLPWRREQLYVLRKMSK